VALLLEGVDRALVGKPAVRCLISEALEGAFPQELPDAVLAEFQDACRLSHRIRRLTFHYAEFTHSITSLDKGVRLTPWFTVGLAKVHSRRLGNYL
jgi:hypothetical protein